MRLVNALNGVFLTLAFALSLFIQNTASALLIPFFILITISFVFGGRKVSPQVLIWIFCIVISGLFLAPAVGNSGYVIMAVFLLLPLVAITATRVALVLCALIMWAFAINLIMQKLFWPSEYFQFPRRAAYPFLDPNTAATMCNIALLPAISYLNRYKNILGIMAVILFTAALICTESRGGILAALIATGVYFAYLNPRLRLPCVGAIIAGIALMLSIPRAREALFQRWEIWESAISLVNMKGHGFGSFHLAYNGIRNEIHTAGMFAHNDLLQMAIENGWPFVIVFICLCISTATRVNRKNIGAFCALLAVFLQSLVNYPFYLAPVSIACGMALWFINNTGRTAVNQVAQEETWRRKAREEVRQEFARRQA